MEYHHGMRHNSPRHKNLDALEVMRMQVIVNKGQVIDWSVTRHTPLF
jgi:hypothetical protein